MLGWCQPEQFTKFYSHKMAANALLAAILGGLLQQAAMLPGLGQAFCSARQQQEGSKWGGEGEELGKEGEEWSGESGGWVSLPTPSFSFVQAQGDPLMIIHRMSHMLLPSYGPSQGSTRGKVQGGHPLLWLPAHCTTPAMPPSSIFVAVQRLGQVGGPNPMSAAHLCKGQTASSMPPPPSPACTPSTIMAGQPLLLSIN